MQTSRKKVRKIPILLYHHVNERENVDKVRFSIEPVEFEKQMKWLSNKGYQTISISEMVSYYTKELSIPDKPICISFDDGYYDNFSNAFPILKKYQFYATIFISTDLINGNNSKSNDPKYLSWFNIHEMAREGFSFESHGCSHRSMIELTNEAVQYEALSSKQIIENKLQTQVQYFCYPFGKTNDRINKLVEKNGYMGAFAGVRFNREGPKNLFEIGRIEIYHGDSMNSFCFKVLNGCSYLSYIKNKLGIYQTLEDKN